MSTPRHTEDRVLTGPEAEAVRATHHPALAELDREAVLGLARRLRDYRDKARDVARDRRRARRGKAEPRGAGPAPAEEGVLVKKQIFAQALKRVNARLATLDGESKRARTTGLLREALARKKAARPHHPQPGHTADDGMTPTDHDRPRTEVDPRKVGSVSQQVKNNQASRDGR